MPSRRALLRTGALGLTAALGGCLFGGDADDGDDETPTQTPTTAPTTQLTAEPDPVQRLQRVDPPAVPDDATAVLANERVRTLVSDAAATDGRVDYLPEDGPVEEDDRLVFDAFDRIRFRGETYNPTSSYAGFAQEATYVVEATETTEREASGEVLDSANLTDAEREIADRLLAAGSYTAGGHEEVPDAFHTFETADYLRTDDTVYRLQGLVGDNIGHHMLTLRDADAGPDVTVVTVADRVVPSDLREQVQAAVSTGNAEPSDDELEGFRAVLGDARFVCTAHAVVELVSGAPRDSRRHDNRGSTGNWLQ
ncbi:hypothetical protein [Haloarchaeobius salinus]|uniref:hypothetical protein n=1 Tax=Haloarchaeobius salinus TaxID=1198298 RepID=UPI002109791A|nr:hypothetical protein [Haloarchaeobius salinus]